MNLALCQDEAATAGIVRVLGEQIRCAIDILGSKSSDPDAAVHEARKAIKRARAALRLLRSAMRRPHFKRVNAVLRDAARPLTDARDAKVLFDALVGLRDHSDAAAKIDTTQLERRLSARRSRAQRELYSSDLTLSRARASLKRVAAASKRWRFAATEWDALGPALKRIYREGRKALKAIGSDPSDENLHELRKQVKHLWHALQILEPAQSHRIGKLAAQAHRLADDLGDDRDLALLRDRIVASRRADTRADQRLVGVLEARRQELQRRALSVAKPLYREAPREFEARLQDDWKQWRVDSAPVRARHAHV